MNINIVHEVIESVNFELCLTFFPRCCPQSTFLLWNSYHASSTGVMHGRLGW